MKATFAFVGALISTKEEFDNALKKYPNAIRANKWCKPILNDKCNFSKLGDMRSLMKNHPLYENINDGHPNPKFLEWWCLEMYNDIKQKNEKTISN